MLSVCERMELARDVLGSHHQHRCSGSSVTEQGEEASEALRKHCLQELQDAIDMAPPKDQVAYRMARERCPDVVATESDPMRFLISEQYDVMVRSFSFLFWERGVNTDKGHL